ncbi:glucose-6-phosphate dehydrogenase assembly protein OpcA [Embleya scabrispora]|uniref:glucose-6-phosphate dehydrogenase assembly protein OpcA n=1 Tax=Embleya scabrispora TaxID=159449 RepID=UPI00036A2C92|nr:glucose-6-phosphate dehydrogenase assembly protein OpcA [Embleya scabrispora]MYS81716.1 glucose-6-phosphate dehydrogenase assembly protein OpcA [Streptomyces sp. SID5474]
MMIDLTDTKSSKINAALVEARRGMGSPTLGMVLTLVIVTDEANQYDAMKAASTAAREHPSRILVVIGRPGAEIAPRLDAEVRVGDSGVGETVLLRMHGELADHAESVVLPLLLPDAPVVVWWPGRAPEVPSKDLLGALATRRVTDAAAPPRRADVLRLRASAYTPGDTDLAWTRTTPWRSLLAAALDQKYNRILGAKVGAKAGNPSAELLALWLTDRLEVDVERVETGGPGITSVTLVTEDGEIVIDRPDGMMASLSSPGQPDRVVALKRREASDLVAEELRRLDPDDVYAATLARAALEAARVPSAASFTESPVSQTPVQDVERVEEGEPPLRRAAKEVGTAPPLKRTSGAAAGKRVATRKAVDQGEGKAAAAKPAAPRAARKKKGDGA